MARRRGDEPKDAETQGGGEDEEERFENRAGGGASFRLDFSVFCDALGASAGVEMLRRGELPRVLEMGRSSHTWEAECACALLCRLAMIRECQVGLCTSPVCACVVYVYVCMHMCMCMHMHMHMHMCMCMHMCMHMSTCHMHMCMCMHMYVHV